MGQSCANDVILLRSFSVAWPIALLSTPAVTFSGSAEKAPEICPRLGLIGEETIWSQPFVHPLHPFVAFREQPNHDVSASSLLLATKGRTSSDHQTCISRKRMAWTGDSEAFVIATRCAIAARTIAFITTNALVY